MSTELVLPLPVSTTGPVPESRFWEKSWKPWPAPSIVPPLPLTTIRWLSVGVKVAVGRRVPPLIVTKFCTAVPPNAASEATASTPSLTSVPPV